MNEHFDFDETKSDISQLTSYHLGTVKDTLASLDELLAAIDMTEEELKEICREETTTE